MKKMKKIQIFVFGTGKSAVDFIQKLKSRNVIVKGLIDNNKKMHGLLVENYIVYSPEVLLGSEYDYLVIASQHIEEIKCQLLKEKLIDKEKIVDKKNSFILFQYHPCDKKYVYIGCGEDRIPGFLHADIRELPGVDIVGPAWALPNYASELDLIYSRHMLEHLTFKEAKLTLRNWLISLKKGGEVYIIVPNADFHCKQWLKAEWSDELLSQKLSNASHASASLWGWQRECDPIHNDYNKSYWDVHKSGYNKKNLRYFLSSLGYTEIKIKIVDKIHIHAIAKK